MLCDEKKDSTLYAYYHAVSGAGMAFGGLCIVLFCAWCCIRRHYHNKEKKLAEQLKHVPTGTEIVGVAPRRV
jgi:hypothetical protein